MHTANLDLGIEHTRGLQLTQVELDVVVGINFVIDIAGDTDAVLVPGVIFAVQGSRRAWACIAISCDGQSIDSIGFRVAQQANRGVEIPGTCAGGAAGGYKTSVPTGIVLSSPHADGRGFSAVGRVGVAVQRDVAALQVLGVNISARSSELDVIGARGYSEGILAVGVGGGG